MVVQATLTVVIHFAVMTKPTMAKSTTIATTHFITFTNVMMQATIKNSTLAVTIQRQTHYLYKFFQNRVPTIAFCKRFESQ